MLFFPFSEPSKRVSSCRCCSFVGKGYNVNFSLKIKQINASQAGDRDMDEKQNSINEERSKMISKKTDRQETSEELEDEVSR